MKVNNLNTVFRIIIITLLTSLYLWFSLDFGFWLSGDMHSGGSLIGPILTPIITISLVATLFYNRKKLRINSMKILLTFISFIIFSFLILSLDNYILILIFKEDYLINKYLFWINIIRLIVAIILTTIVYIKLTKIVKKKYAT